MSLNMNINNNNNSLVPVKESNMFNRKAKLVYIYQIIQNGNIF